MDAPTKDPIPGGRLSAIEIAIIVVIVGILAVVALPGLYRTRMASNEAAAIATLRSIVSAQVSYASVCGGGRYATAFATLGRPAPGATQPFLAEQATGDAPEHELDGYRFRLGPGEGGTVSHADCHGSPTHTAYYASATPVSFGSSGGRAFAVNTVGTIWQTPAAAAPAEPFAAPATPIQ